MKICRECGFMKSDNYTDCPECKIPLEYFEGYEEHPNYEELLNEL